MDGENAELTEQSIMLACKGQSCSTNAWILRLTSFKEVSTFKRCGQIESKSEAWFMMF
jgi:hypothetical protein